MLCNNNIVIILITNSQLANGNENLAPDRQDPQLHNCRHAYRVPDLVFGRFVHEQESIRNLAQNLGSHFHHVLTQNIATEFLQV